MRVRPWVKETLGSWASFLSGNGLTYNEGPQYEAVHGEKYSTAAVTRAYYETWLGQKPNYATPVHLLDLMNFLNDFTERLEAQMELIMSSEGVTTCEELEVKRPGLGSACTDLERWRIRLDEYSMAVASVPADDQYDRTATLWDVTAPLFLGWYGGETGDDPIPVGGFPEDFDTDVQHPPDIGTPYTLANQLGIAQAWEKERKHRLVEQFRPSLTLPDITLPKSNNIRNLAIAAGVGAVLFAIIRK